jgi:hypothetical protein
MFYIFDDAGVVILLSALALIKPLIINQLN